MAATLKNQCPSCEHLFPAPKCVRGVVDDLLGLALRVCASLQKEKTRHKRKGHQNRGSSVMIDLSAGHWKRLDFLKVTRDRLCAPSSHYPIRTRILNWCLLDLCAKGYPGSRIRRARHVRRRERVRYR